MDLKASIISQKIRPFPTCIFARYVFRSFSISPVVIILSTSEALDVQRYPAGETRSHGKLIITIRRPSVCSRGDLCDCARPNTRGINFSVAVTSGSLTAAVARSRPLKFACRRIDPRYTSYPVLLACVMRLSSSRKPIVSNAEEIRRATTTTRGTGGRLPIVSPYPFPAIGVASREQRNPLSMIRVILVGGGGGGRNGRSRTNFAVSLVVRK